jgi:hypothetical protein
MAVALPDRVRAARQELAVALRLAEDPAFDPGTLDLALVQRLQSAVGAVALGMAQASADERDRERNDPEYRFYLEDLKRMGPVLDLWYERLLAHRSELDRARAHVDAANRWAEAYNRTR